MRKEFERLQFHEISADVLPFLFAAATVYYVDAPFSISDDENWFYDRIKPLLHDVL